MNNSIELTPIGLFDTGIFDDSAAEIPAFDAASQRLFVTNSANSTIDVLDLSDPSNPSLAFAIDIEPFGDGVNSVAVNNGIVAAAIESDPATEPGTVVFFDADGNVLNQVTAGALPDQITFTPDGTKVLVANEGEADEDDPEINPPGSISVIDIADGVANATVTDVGFTSFDGQEETLRERGIRIFPDVSVSEDVEPEFITVSGDSSTAFVALQENNAIAVVDLEALEVTDLQPLGATDFSRGLPKVTNYVWDLSGEVLGTTPAGQEILLGGLSGLFYEGTTDDGKLQFITTPDRGPNGEPTDVDDDGIKERPFPLPDYQAQLVRFTLDQESGEFEITEEIHLTREDGETPITGLPNLQAGEPGSAYTDEEPVDLFGETLENDPFGADMESVLVAPDGSFWLSDEYRPAIYHFDAQGVLIDRFIPQGTASAEGQPEGTFGTETLPEIYAQRRGNRGFEGMALNTDNGNLYAFIQSPIDNPDVSDAEAKAVDERTNFNSRNSQVLRILEVDPTTGSAVGEYVYFLEGSPGVDKIGDAVYIGDGKFNVIERDSGTDADSEKFIFEVDLTGATNILGTGLSTATGSDTALEGMTPDDLAAMGIQPVTKTQILNLPSIGYNAGDKPEGLALLDDGSLAVINDNDFGLLDEEVASDGSVPFNPDPTQTVLGIIEFDPTNALDPSDEDGGINIANQPVFGLFQPDSIDSYEVEGETFIVTANEGDSRDEEADVIDLELDPTAFPNAAELQLPEVIGNLEVSTIDGDLDGDGDFDQLFAYGSRSFSIRDSHGNIVFDSGDDFETITAELVPEIFNSNGTVDSFDVRSNDSGPEPEGVAIGEVEGRTFAFIGLERTGGIMIYDITFPAESKFVQYINPLDAETGDALNLAPEGLVFISAEDSPNGEPLLAVANEISGTTSIFEITSDILDGGATREDEDSDESDEGSDDGSVTDGTFTLQILHGSDQEAGLDALVDAPNFSAVLEALRDEDLDGDGTPGFENTLTLSSGDAYIPSPFFAASDDAFGDFGRGDIIIQNELGFQAIAFGNHEFDLGTGEIEDLIEADEEEEEDFPGTQFPYLSSNLDFSGDDNLAGFVVEDGQEASEIPNSIAGNTIITVNGEQIGVVGAITPTLEEISSPTDVTIAPIEFDSNNPDDIAALAAEIQDSVDSLLVDNPEINKVVLLAHMQLISIEEQLSELLTDVDIIVAGGSNTILTDETDVLRAGDESAGAYPILNTAADGNPIAVVNTDGNYRYVGRLVVDFDSEGVIIPESVDPEISGAFATDEAGVAAVGGTPNPKVVEVTDAISAVIAEQGGNTFGNTDVFLNGQRVDIRSEETNFGNLAADANLIFAQSIDPEVTVSIRNGGGIRDSIGEVITPAGSTSPEDVEFLPPQANEIAGTEDGEISQLDIANSLSFNNGITLVTVTAEELLALIENGVSESEPGAEPGRFPQVSGISFSFDASLEPGERVVSLAAVDESGNVTDVVVENGEVVGDLTRTFRTVTLDFLADGGDDFPFPDTERVDLIAEDTEPTGEATFAPDGTEQDVLAEFIAENFSETPFDIADTPVEEDTRIQNLAFREDTILSSDVPIAEGTNTDDSVEDVPEIPVEEETDSSELEFIGEVSFETGFTFGDTGVGNNLRLYEIDLSDAPDISGVDSLGETDIAPVEKELLLDFGDLGIDLDNSEAISFGEILPDGRQSLIVVSDNNFSDSQETQFLTFAIGEADTTSFI